MHGFTEIGFQSMERTTERFSTIVVPDPEALLEKLYRHHYAPHARENRSLFLRRKVVIVSWKRTIAIRLAP